MANQQTIGYIVVSKSSRPMVWFEDEGQFYYFNGAKASMFGIGDYEQARSRIGRHCKQIAKRHFASDVFLDFAELRIVRLVAP